MKFTYKPNENSITRLTNEPRYTNTLRSAANAIEDRTKANANWRGYRSDKHWRTVVTKDLQGRSVVRVENHYSFAHLDEWGGAMYGPGATRPMRRAIESLGFRRVRFL